MNTTKLLYALVGLLISLLLTIAGWWVTKVNDNMTITQQLQFRSIYLNGQVPAAPVQPIPNKK